MGVSAIFRKTETHKAFLRRMKSNVTKAVNRYARKEGYGGGYKQMEEEGAFK